MNNKEIFSKNLKYYLSKSNMTQTELAKLLNYPEMTVSNWINAKTYPRIDKIEKMANFFGVTKADLVEDNSIDNNINYISRLSNTVKIPIYGTIIAGIPAHKEDNIDGWVEISQSRAKSGDYFALRVTGNSMNPNFIENDIIIVRKQLDVDSGELAIITVNGDEATFKKIVKSENGVTLVPLNVTDYSPIFYSNEQIESLPIKIIGKVIELRRSL